MQPLETYWIGKTRLGRKLAEYLYRCARWVNGFEVLPPLAADDAGEHLVLANDNGHQPADFALIYDAADNRYINAGTVQIGATATAVSALTIDGTEQDYWVECTRTSANVWSVNGTIQAGSIGTLYANSAGAVTLKIPIGTMAAGGWTQRHTGRIVFLPDFDEDRVRTNADDTTSDYLYAKMQDTGSKGAGDVIAYAEVVNNFGNRKVRHWVDADDIESVMYNSGYFGQVRVDAGDDLDFLKDQCEDLTSDAYAVLTDGAPVRAVVVGSGASQTLRFYLPFDAIAGWSGSADAYQHLINEAGEVAWANATKPCQYCSDNTPKTVTITLSGLTLVASCCRSGGVMNSTDNVSAVSDVNDEYSVSHTLANPCRWLLAVSNTISWDDYDGNQICSGTPDAASASTFTIQYDANVDKVTLKIYCSYNGYTYCLFYGEAAQNACRSATINNILTCPDGSSANGCGRVLATGGTATVSVS